MAHYLVTMDLPEGESDGALPSIERFVGTIRETILPTLEALAALKERGAVLAGGYPSGKGSIMLVMEADSKARAMEMLEEVPGWEAASTEVTRLHTVEELSGEQPAV